jgi:DNA-binding LacI/PurR family transcriptional regulator
MRRLLESAPDLDGVFVASDLMAAGALQVLHEAGRRVPQDVAVIGFDDAPIALTTRPTLSSVRQSLDAMGRELANLVLASIEHRDQVVRKVVLATELIVRESSGGQPTEHA